MKIDSNTLAMWIENAAINQQTETPDISKWKPDNEYKLVVISGIGMSARVLTSRAPLGGKVLHVSNQSCAKRDFDIAVITDPQLGAIDNRLRYRKPRDMFVANIASPYFMERGDSYKFYHPVNAGQDRVLRGLNTMLEVGATDKDTFVLQAGCSLNAALIIVCQMMINGQINKCPVHLVGMDFAYPDVEHQRADGERDCDPKNVILGGPSGYLTSPQLEAYAKDCITIAKSYGEVGIDISTEDYKVSLIAHEVETRKLVDML